jgi:hypothetical protein
MEGPTGWTRNEFLDRVPRGSEARREPNLVKSAPEETPMSRVNGEKARANVARRNRTARREKDRARLAEIKAGKTTQPAEPAKDKAAK